ncbi:hypothetical protein BJ742DRAFT_735735 [Cladochytrium replicatum]|nr:hypothetical protein BJ742DRAFT_735735 [Cladochytrium replicatum]
MASSESPLPRSTSEKSKEHPQLRYRDQDEKDDRSFLSFPLIVAIILCAAVISSPAIFQNKFHALSSQVQSWIYGPSFFTGPVCSGHGVMVNSGRCVCDLQWRGTYCSEQVTIEPPRTSDNSILFVLESFGPINPTNDPGAASFSYLAEQLAEEHFDVSILYIGAPNPQFGKIAAQYARKRIHLIQLPTSGLAFGNALVEKRAFDVFQFLKTRVPAYKVVYFTSFSGAGYYTLLSQRQGLFCSSTKFIVGLDSLWQSEIEKLDSGDPEYVATDVDTLKFDYVQKKSVELADHVVVSSQMLLDFVQSHQWQVPGNSARVIHGVPISEHRELSRGVTTINELVFVGDLDFISGLKTFSDAIDELATDLKENGIKVTFIGTPRYINEMTSEEYLQLRGPTWDDSEVSWSIRTVGDRDLITSYLQEGGGSRLAIMPTFSDPTALIAQDLAHLGLPFITTTESAAKELMLQSDLSSILFNPTAHSLVNKVRAIMYNGATIARPKDSADHAIGEWHHLLSTLFAMDTSSCSTAFSELKDLPLVSLVLTHRNRHKLLKQAIASIEAQTYANFEVILVDDGSTDPDAIQYLNEISWSWWEERGWKVVRETNRFVGASRNTGAKHAVGKYVVFMDDDDIAKPDFLETLVKVAINTGADVVTSGHDVFKTSRPPLHARSERRYIPLGDAPLVGVLENVFGDSHFLVKKDHFVDMGGFTEVYGVGFEDYELLAKLALKGSHMEPVPDALTWYRTHENSVTAFTNLKANQVRMLRAYADAQSTACREQQRLVEYAEKVFFEENGVLPFQHELRNTTMTGWVTWRSRSPETTEVVPFPEAATATQTAVPTPSCTEEDMDCNYRCPHDMNYYVDCAKVTALEPNVIPNTRGIPIVLIGQNLFHRGTRENIIVVAIQGEPIEPNYIKGSTSDGTQLTIVLPVELPLASNSRNGTAVLTVRTVGPSQNPNSRGIPYTLQYYNPRAAILSVKPTMIPIKSSTDLIITGSGLVKYPEALCIFNISASDAASFRSDPLLDERNLLVARPAFIRNSTSLICRSPVLNDFGKIRVQVMFSTPQYNVIRQPGDIRIPRSFMNRTELYLQSSGVVLTLVSPAPRMVRAVFALSGDRLSIYFDKPLKIPTLDAFGSGTALPCGSLFEINNGGVIIATSDTDSDCLISRDTDSPNDRLLMFWKPTILAKPINLLVPGQGLRVLDDQIYDASFAFSAASSGEVIASSPNGTVAPIFSLLAPQMVPGCSGIPIQMQVTGGTGGRRFNQVRISFASPGAGRDDVLNSALNRTGNDVRINRLSSFTIGANVTDPRRYNFTVTLTNLWGQTASQRISVWKRTEVDVPVLVFSPMDMSVVPVKTVNNLIGTVYPSCANITSSVLFQWTSIIDESQNRGAPNPFPAISTKPLFSLTQFSLLPGRQYDFNINAGYDGKDKDGKAYNNYDFSLSIVAEKDNVFVSAGSSRLTGTENKVLLNAIIGSDGYSNSFMAANKENSDLFECVWDCVRLDEGTPSGTLSSCTDVTTTERLPLTNICQGNILTGKLEPGYFYRFNTTLTNKDTASSRSSFPIYLQVVEGLIPSVDLAPTDGYPGAWSDSFFVDSAVDPTSLVPGESVADVEYTWSIPTSCDFLDFPEIKLVEKQNTKTAINNRALKLIEGTLSADSQYCIQLTVSSGSFEGRSTIRIATRDRPSGGQCVVSSATVGLVSFEDNFAVSCSDFVTDLLSYPIFYQIESRAANAADGDPWNILSAWTTVNTYSQYQSSGDKIIRISIKDSADSPASSPILIPITVLGERQATNPALMARQKILDPATVVELQKANTALDDTITNYNQFGDVSAAQNSIAVIAGVLVDSTFGTTIEKTIQTKLATFLIRLSQDSTADYQSGALWFSDVLAKVAGNQPTLAQDVFENLFDLVSKIITDASANGKVSGKCFDVTTSGLFGKSLGTIVGSSLSAPSTKLRTNLPLTLQKLEACLSRPQACGQTPSTITNTYLNRTAGVADPTKPNTLCSSFQPQKFENYFSGVCFAYSCGGKSAKGLFSDKGSLLGIDYTTVYDFSVRTLSTEAQVEIKSDPTKDTSVIFDLPVTSSFNAQYNVIGLPITQKYIGGGYTNAPICAFISDGLSTPSTAGCKVIGNSASSKTIRCQCDHLTDFMVGVNAMVDAPVSSPSPTVAVGPSPSPIISEPGSNIGIIVGAVCGAVFLIAGVAATVYILKKRKQRKVTVGDQTKELQEARKQPPPAPPAEPTPPPAQPVPETRAEAEIVPVQEEVAVTSVPSASRRRDPALLPAYQSPPTYAEHMANKSGSAEDGSPDEMANHDPSSSQRDLSPEEGSANQGEQPAAGDPPNEGTA